MATFPGGRIEQFIPSRRITVDEWTTSPVVNKSVARVVAEFHLLTLPISKEPWKIRSRVTKCLEQFNKRKSDFQAKGYLLNELFGLINFPIEEELTFIESLFEKVTSRVVFASNDLNRSNFLVLQDENGKDKCPLEMIIIDYEFCSYNYRGCDLGNHFAMKFYDFGSEAIVTGHSYPSLEYRKQFIETYLDEICKNSKCPTDWDPNGFDSLDHILLESLIGSLATRLIDIAWTLRDLNIWIDIQRKHNGCVSKISQLDFSVFYYERKNELMTNYPNLFDKKE